ncbi:hypothetical protein ACNRWW_05835 [Metabacillus sp. HB246100]
MVSKTFKTRIEQSYDSKSLTNEIKLIGKIIHNTTDISELPELIEKLHFLHSRLTVLLQKDLA